MFSLQPFLCVAGEVKQYEGKALHRETHFILEQISPVKIKQQPPIWKQQNNAKNKDSL